MQGIDINRGVRDGSGGKGWFVSLSHENGDRETACRWGTHAKTVYRSCVMRVEFVVDVMLLRKCSVCVCA